MSDEEAKRREDREAERWNRETKEAAARRRSDEAIQDRIRQQQARDAQQRNR